MSAKYSLLKEEDCLFSDSTIFDFSSPFKFKDSQLRFNSIFTYRKSLQKTCTSSDHSADQRTSDLICTWTLTFLSYILLICTAPVSVWFCFKILADHERALIFRLGRIHSIRGPGIILILPCIEKWQKTDIRMHAFSIPPQQFISMDGAILEIGAEVQFRIVDIPLSVLHVKNLDESYRIIGRSIFVNYLFKKTLSELQQDRTALCAQFLDKLNEVTMDWGVKIENIKMSEVKILKMSEPQCPLSKLLSSFQNQSLKTTHNKDTQHTSSLESSNKTENFQKLSERLKFLSKTGAFGRINAVITLEIIGSYLETFHIIFQNGEIQINSQNSYGNSDVTIRMSEYDFERIYNHEATPLEVYISGHLQVEGNIQLLMQFQSAMQAIPQHSVKSTIIDI